MPLELKDLASQKSVMVPEEGITFGREGGDANIQLRDTGVSKRHARVFGENGAWFLEDLGSSNGTWLQKERIKDATELLPGDVFQLSQAKFEVVQVMGDEGVEPTNMARDEEMGDAGGDEEPPPDENEPTPKPMAPAAKDAPSKGMKAPPSSKENSVSKSKPAPAAKEPPPKKGAKGAAAEDSKSVDKAAKGPAGQGPTDPGVAGEPKKISFGYFLLTVPKAFAWYLAAIPVLLLNPVGTIRKAVKEQKYEPKGRMELIAYALPGYLISAAFGFLGSLIVGIVTGTLSIGSILPIGPLIGAVIGAAVTGFVWHPALNWWVNFLKGTSDDRSRTNLFMLYMPAFAAIQLPAFVAAVLGLVRLPLIGLVPLVLSLAASLMMLFVFFVWFSAAGVVKWFRIVLMVLGALAALSTLRGLPSALTGGGGSSIASSSGDAEAQVAAAQAEAERMRKEAEAQVEAAQKQGEAAQDAADKQVAAAQKPGPAPTPAAAAAKPPEKGAPTPPPAEPEKAAPPPAPTPAAAAAAAPTPAPAAAGKPEAPVAAAAGGGGGGYAAWHNKYEAIEKRITDDPTILNKKPDVLTLYKQLQEDVYEIDSKFAKGKKPQERKVSEHLRDAELYEKTEKTVNELYGKLPH